VDFEALANEHKDAVYRQMIRACGNREDAEDVLVEALLKAYRHMDQLRDLVAFRSWLAQIAKRVCWQLKTREALVPLMQLSALEDEGLQISSKEPPMEQRLALQEMKRMLAEAVNSLAPDYRVVYEMRDLQEVPGDETAKMLGISPAAMKSRLHRAREIVRQYLDAALTRTATKRPKESGSSEKN
jgi:RNA polymerase sigma-70 factor, ECF subfamily